MTPWVQPKLVGQKAPLNATVPPAIHQAATVSADRLGLSRSEYIEHLIARDHGMTSPLDRLDRRASEQQESLPMKTQK